MRKDSEAFLRKCLQYRIEKKKDAFEIDINYFSEIPNIEIEINEIMEELKMQKCISRKSELTGKIIHIYLTLDGITYFDDYKGKEQKITVNINGDQINIATDHGMIDAKKEDIRNIPKTIVINEKAKRSISSDILGNQLMFLCMIGIVVLTVYYLKYRAEVQIGLVLTSMIIEVITVWVYYRSKKAFVIYGKNIKEMVRFNIIGILGVPLLIGIINMPFYTSIINLDAFKQSVDMNGIVNTFLNSEYSVYAVSQTGGMLVIMLFMMHIICSDVYIIAVTNIAIGRSGKWFWQSLFKLTYKSGKDWKRYVLTGVILFILSMVCVIGIIPYISDGLKNINAKNFSVT